MRILMVITEFHEGISGGAGTYAYRLSRELTRQGHHVEVITSRSRVTVAVCDAVHVLKLSKIHIIGLLRWSIAACKSARSLMKAHHFDVIHVHHPLAMTYALLETSRVPMVVSMHTGWALANPRQSTQRRIAEFLRDLATSKRSSRIIVLNRYSETQLTRYGVPHEKVQYIPNGIDCSEFVRENQGVIREKLGIPRNAIVALCVGRLEKGKGVDILLAALEIIQTRTTRQPLWTVIVGDGSLRESLRTRGQRIPNVIFTGSVSREALLDTYSDADLFVMPSEGGEGMPTVVLEAMASGLPILSTRVPGVTDLTEGHFAELVDPGDPEQLALVMLRMTSDLEDLKRRGRDAMVFSRKYDWQIIASHITKVYESCQRKRTGS